MNEYQDIYIYVYELVYIMHIHNNQLKRYFLKIFIVYYHKIKMKSQIQISRSFCVILCLKEERDLYTCYITLRTICTCNFRTLHEET